MKKIVLTGGGSAGHVIPALALTHELAGYEIHYIGGQGIEKDIVGRLDLPYHEITTTKLKRSITPSNLLIPFRLLKGIKDAKKVLQSLSPAVVFSKGGFVSLPVVIAAKRLNIPVVAHESDITVGLANRMSKKYVNKICTSFETTAATIGKKAIFTGTPLRREIYEGNKNYGLSLLRFSANKPVVLFMGGSLGAVAINNTLREALPALTKKYNICHIAGRGNTEAHLESGSYRQYEFTSDIPHLFAAADIVVSRAGANAVAEILALNKASLLIPLPKAASRGDQILNAEYYKTRGLVSVLPQENMTKDTLIEAVDKVFTERHKTQESIKKAPPIDGTNFIAKLIKTLAEEET